MHQKMPIKLKNWKLAVLALIGICLLCGLGCWQLARAKQKSLLLQTFAARTAHSPLSEQDIAKSGDLRFYRARLTGRFDNAHSILLDNKVFHGKVGYEVYTPFLVTGTRQVILVDRGFLPLGASRSQLPVIPNIFGTVSILGVLNLPSAYISLGKMTDNVQVSWPLRVEYIDLAQLSKLMSNALFTHALILDPKDKSALPLEWQIVTMSPEKHVGYAIQWFALALTLLIIFLALNRVNKN
jgi:surfeit locus 1 family protein